jgi:hypothetical protein
MQSQNEDCKHLDKGDHALDECAFSNICLVKYIALVAHNMLAQVIKYQPLNFL